MSKRKNNKKKAIQNKLKEFAIDLVLSVLATMWVLGVFIIINSYVEWVCADNTRFTISIAIFSALITKLSCKAFLN